MTRLEAMMSATEIDPQKLEAVMGQAVLDMGAAISAPLFVIGERLGLYKAMADAGPLTSTEVAERAGVAERSVREWLRNQAAAGYVGYDPAADTYELPPEQALALADDESPYYLLGAFELIASLYADEDRILDAFRSGEGMGWHEHDHRLFRGTERFFRPGYKGNLVAEWIPALEGVEEKLAEGAKVADVGCGHGASTVLMAEAFPASEFHGFDYAAPGPAQRGRPFRPSPGRGRPFRPSSGRGRPFPPSSGRGRPFRPSSGRGRPFPPIAPVTTTAPVQAAA
jgi:hypothetical protein